MGRLAFVAAAVVVAVVGLAGTVQEVDHDFAGCLG